MCIRDRSARRHLRRAPELRSTLAPRAVCPGARASPRMRSTDAGWSSSVARWAHNPEVAGSNPAPATRKAQVRSLSSAAGGGASDRLAADWQQGLPHSTSPGSPLVHLLSLIHISEPTRLLSISYAVFCLKKKNNQHIKLPTH